MITFALEIELFFRKSWIDNGVCYIKNILNENGILMTFKSFNEKYRINTNYITYIGYIHIINSYIRKTGLTVEGNGSLDLIKTLKIIYTQQKGAHLYYEVPTHDTNKPNCCEKWEAKLNKNINWFTTFKKIQKLQETKLKWFQIRLVHRILGTNVVLKHMGIKNDYVCSFCRKERDTINHLFRRCACVQQFWKQFQMAINDGC